MAEELAELAQDTLEAGRELRLLGLENSDGDGTYGDFEDFLTALDENLSSLSFVACAVWADTEYGGPGTPSILYSPPGSSGPDLKNFSGLASEIARLPDEDWIPCGWRHLNEKAPAAKAEGTVALLGDWGGAEKALVDKAMMGGVLEAMGCAAFEKGHEAVTRTDEGWSFFVSGAMDAGEMAENLHLALLSYIKEHEAACAALCRAMREKKLSIHLYLNESTGPNAAWSYCSRIACSG